MSYRRDTRTTGWLIGGGLVMGLGIGAMHYIGMAGMRVAADMLYTPLPFVLSLVVAPSFAIASLYTVRWAIRQSSANPVPAVLLSGAIMGLAVSAMHYTGMWAATFLPLASPVGGTQAPGIDAVHLTMLVAAAIFVIVALAVVAVVTDHRFKQLRATAQSEAEKFALLLEAVPDGVIGVNADGEIRLMNSRVQDLFGYRKNRLLGRPLDMLMPERFGETGVRLSADFLSGVEPAAPGARLKLRGRRADQSEFPAEVSTNRIATPEGQLTTCAIRDVTDQELARAALREANERLTAGMATLESQSRELRLLTDLGELLHGCEEEKEAYEIIGNAVEPILERKRILLIAIAEKVSAAVANLRLREELRNQSIRDPLTGLLNRRFMEEALEREIVRAMRTATTLSIVAIDLDHFKRFNDTFGHEGGDLVLREAGAVLSKAAHGDNLACRLGGEELMLILPDTPLESAVSLAETIRRKIERLSVMFRGQQLGKITASFGVAEFPRHGDGQREVLRAADQALYRAKAAGRNRVEVAERIEDTLSVSVRAFAALAGASGALDGDDDS